MRCACIDVGSNTTRLLVADAVRGGISEVRNERAFTLIGRSLEGGSRIPAEKIEETAQVVAAQVREARALGTAEIRAVATAAIRRAANARALVEAVHRHTGIRLEVLTGEEEARLAFRGAARAAAGDGKLAVIDVGGGSTEVAWGDAAGEIAGSCSIAIGSSLLAERHLSAAGAPTEPELAAARAEVAQALAGFEAPPVDRAVAVGGSASSLEHLAGDCLGAAELDRALDLLRAEPVAAAAERYGLAPERVRLMPAGLLVLAELRARIGRPLRVCKGGLREGVILQMLGTPTP